MDYFAFVRIGEFSQKKKKIHLIHSTCICTWIYVLIWINLEYSKWVTAYTSLFISIKNTQTIFIYWLSAQSFLYSLLSLSADMWPSLKICSLFLFFFSYSTSLFCKMSCCSVKLRSEWMYVLGIFTFITVSFLSLFYRYHLRVLIGDLRSPACQNWCLAHGERMAHLQYVLPAESSQQALL